MGSRKGFTQVTIKLNQQTNKYEAYDTSWTLIKVFPDFESAACYFKIEDKVANHEHRKKLLRILQD